MVCLHPDPGRGTLKNYDCRTLQNEIIRMGRELSNSCQDWRCLAVRTNSKT